MLDSREEKLLRLDSVITGYGKKQVISRVNLEVATGEIVALLGHNGSGKSTLLKSIFGLLPLWEGEIFFHGLLTGSHRPLDMLKKGVAYVPQGNRVFDDLTVIENIQIGGTLIKDRTKLVRKVERVLSIFPALRERAFKRAGTLSGGEKQMLSLANSLILAPDLLLLDEPSLGLSPQLSVAVLDLIVKLSTDHNIAVLIVEQKVREALRLANRVYILRNGTVTYSGDPGALKDQERLRDLYL